MVEKPLFSSASLPEDQPYPHISVVIPARNEAQNLRHVLPWIPSIKEKEKRETRIPRQFLQLRIPTANGQCPMLRVRRSDRRYSASQRRSRVYRSAVSQAEKHSGRGIPCTPFHTLFYSFAIGTFYGRLWLERAVSLISATLFSKDER